MKWKEALAQAEKTGGTINWSKEKDFYIEPQYKAEQAPWHQRASIPFGAWPWQTETGEGFMAPWGRQFLSPEGRLTRYQQGMPQLGWTAQRQLGEVGYQEPMPSWLKTIPPTPEQLAETGQAEADEAMGLLGLDGAGMGGQFVRLEQMDGYVVPVYQDEEGKEYMAWTEAQPSRETAEEQEPMRYEPYARGGQYKGWTFNPYTGQYEQPTDWISPYQQEQLDLQQQQFDWQQEYARQQMEAERQQRLAQLAAQPMSWLQYGLESGAGSQVQPWMQPLSQGKLTTGQPLTTGKETTLTNLPELTMPSMQYFARMAPSQQQQMYGYEQARTGATPEDVMGRQWMRSAPSGRFSGFSWRS